VALVTRRAGALQSDIARLQAEMARGKLTAGRRSAHPKRADRSLQQREVVDHLKRMEELHEMVRMEKNKVYISVIICNYTYIIDLF